MRTLFGIILALFCTATFLEAKDMNALSTNERNLATIAANTARGDMANLKTALNKVSTKDSPSMKSKRV